MTYEEIWRKIKGMSQKQRSMLAYEMTLKGFNVGYIHPHYYFDARSVHDILFYPPHGQYEITDSDGKYFDALKEVMENDKEIHIQFKRYSWLTRLINDWREGKVIRSYICSRFNCGYVNAWYRILPGDSLAGERPRSLFIMKKDGGEAVYRMTAAQGKDMTFTCSC